MPRCENMGTYDGRLLMLLMLVLAVGTLGAKAAPEDELVSTYRWQLNNSKLQMTCNTSAPEGYYHYYYKTNITAPSVWTTFDVIANTTLSCESIYHDVVRNISHNALSGLPLAPTLLNCTNYNYERIVCPDPSPQQDNVTLYYSISHLSHKNGCPSGRPSVTPPWQCAGRGGAIHWCSIPCDNGSCTLPKSVARFHDTPEFYICTEAINSQGSGVYFAHPRPADFSSVKLKPVTSLTVKMTNDTSSVAWQHIPLPPVSSIYMISISPDRRTGQSADMLFVNITTHTFRGLLPNTQYTISVRSRIKDIPAVWSDPTLKVERTKEGVPGRPPHFTTGSFAVSHGPVSDSRSVWLYWETLPANVRHGKITGFRFTYYATNESPQDGNVSGDVAGVELQLMRDKTYHVQVDARTVVGYNKKSNATQLTIPAESEILEGPTTIDAFKNDSHVLVRWVHKENPTSYTVYWCHSTVNARHCQSSFSWVHVPETERNATLRMESGTVYLTAVSVQRGGRTSGMHFAECIRSIDLGTMKPVKFRIDVERSRDNVTLEWSIPDCLETAPIAHVSVYYCRTDRCNRERPLVAQVAGTEISATLGPLDRGHTYRIYAISKSATDQSEPTANLTYVVPAHTPVLRDWEIGLLVTGCVVGFVLLVIGVMVILGNVRTRWEKYTTIPIELPTLKEFFPGESGDDEQNNNGL